MFTCSVDFKITAIPTFFSDEEVIKDCRETLGRVYLLCELRVIYILIKHFYNNPQSYGDLAWGGLISSVLDVTLHLSVPRD